jgi:CRP/FNR family cyclic AMP-dependent transcriptional regulator
MHSQEVGHPTEPIRMPTAHERFIAALEHMATSCTLARGTILFRQGQNPDGVFIVRKGSVRLLFQSHNRRHTYRIVGQGHVLGLPAIVTGNSYSLTAEALKECELALINGKHVMNLLRHRHDLMLYVVANLAEEVSRIQARTKVLVTSSR